MNFIKTLFVSILGVMIVSSCEKDEMIKDNLFKTWDLEWKQCGVYHNSYDAKLNFSTTDSGDFGWFKEQGEDTIFFDIEVVSDEKVFVKNSTDSLWDGALDVEEFFSHRLVFQREQVECENELFRFN